MLFGPRNPEKPDYTVHLWCELGEVNIVLTNKKGEEYHIAVLSHTALDVNECELENAGLTLKTRNSRS